MSSNSCPVHKIGRHAAVRGALHNPELTAEHPFRATRLTIGPTILDSDGPKQVIGKRLLSKLFAADRMADYRVRLVAPAVRDAWDRLSGHGKVDLVEEIAMRIPPPVIFGILDLAQEQAVDVYRRLMRPVIRFIGDNRTGYGDALRAHEELVTFVESELAARRDGAPRRTIDEVMDDLLSAGTSRREAIAAVILLMLAGTETTVCALANVFHAIAGHPTSWQDVLDDRLSSRAFVEEVLRIEAPIHHTHRFATVDTSTATVDTSAAIDVPLKRGAVVEVCLFDANHSEERIGHPERWDPREGRGMGATFGLGPHACIGKSLAICELLELVAVLKRDRFQAGAMVEHGPMDGVTFRRPARLVAIR